MRRATVSGVAGVLLLGASIASAATLDVATGMWEVTSQGQASGMPPIPPEALAKMTPDQRAKVEAAMAAAMGRANKPDVSRSCITQKELERGLHFNEHDRPNCKQTTLNSTPRLLDAHTECTGNERTTGNIHIEAVDRHTIRGNFDFVVTDGTSTMTMKRTLQGKWLGNDCGNVKPSE
jgi:hypothetical protein